MPVDLTNAPKPPPTRQQRQKAATVDRRLETYEGAVHDAFQLIGFGAMLLGQHADAGAIAKHGRVLEPVYAKAAVQYEPFGKLLDYFITTGPLAEIIAVTLPFAIQILANHKLVQPGIMGTVPPEALAAEIKAGIVRQQMEAMAQQQAAEAELQAMIAQQNGQTS